MKKIAALSIFLLPAMSSDAASIAWSATPGVGYGFDQVSGTDLPAGSLVRVGSFNISDTLIQQNAANVSYLNSNFVEAGFTTIGTGVGGNAGFFSTSSNYNATTTGLAGKQVFFWVFSSTNNSTPALSISTATQIGIYYEPLASNATWTFPTDVPTPGSTTVQLGDLVGASTVRPEAKLVVGTFGPGTSSLSTKTNFTLSNVPEPGSASLALTGGLWLLSRRRRS